MCVVATRDLRIGTPETQFPRGTRGGFVMISRFSWNVSISRGFHLVGRNLRGRRRHGGGVELTTHEIRFVGSHTEEITAGEDDHLEIHETIEELMVAANSAVAQKLVAHFPSNALLRKHDAPPADKLKRLHAICDYLGIEVNTANNYTFARSIDAVRKLPSSAEKDMLMLLFRKWVFPRVVT